MSDQEYTLEELNYFRVCYITTSIIRDGLQSVFKQEWDRIHGWSLGPWKDTAKNGQDFFNMESSRSRRRNNKLLRIIQNGNTNEWDPTCFFFAILFSDSLGHLVSPTVAINVDALRVFRNGVFAHLSQASILETDFQANMKLVSNAFMSLHLDTKQLQRIGNQVSFPTGELQQLQEKIGVLEEELQEPKSFICLPPKPSHEVTERKTEAGKIMQMFTDLQNNSNDRSIVTVYAYGNPGCGKSQIARDVGKKLYDQALAENDPDSCTCVMTFNAESEQSMIDSYYKFARELSVTEYSLNSITGSDSKLKPGERISYLKTLVSSKLKDYSTWLLIFDNANDLDSLKGCWPDEEWRGSGKVLVTTQDSFNVPFADRSCKVISLSDGMQMGDALSLLRSICPLSCDDEEIERSVIRALDYQPLAIACAAFYVGHTNTVRSRTVAECWNNYLKKLEMGKRHLTEKTYERINNSYPLSMTSAVTIAVEKLVQNDVFRHVVHCLGLGAPDPIDLDIIVSFVTKQDPAVDEDMVAADVAKCSLLIPLFQDDSPRTLIDVHQVVHDAFKRHLGKCSIEGFAALTQTYIKTLSPFAQHNLLQFELEFHICSKLMAPHFKSFVNHLGSPPLNCVASDLSSGERDELKNTFLNFGDVCSTHDHLLAAITYFEHALEIANDESDGNDDHNRSKFIATTLNNLGIVYCKRGKFEKAKDHQKRALTLFQSLNSHNPSTEIANSVADTLNKLGIVFYSLGHFEVAKAYHCRSITMREELFGIDHPTVASSLNNLGCVYDAQGNYQIALEYYQRSLVLEEKIYGKLHPRVVDCLCNLGIVHSELGSTEKAIHYHKQALEMRKELYFPDHFLISESYNNLGLMYKGMGQLERAMHYYEAAMRIREKVLHAEHPAIADLLDNLGQLYMEQGELQKSKEFHNRALDIRIDSLGRDHCKVGDSFLNLGLVHEQCFELDDAAKCFQSAVEIYSESYPKRHHLCELAEEYLECVSQQRADLHDPVVHVVHLTDRDRLRMTLESSIILSNAYYGSHWGRHMQQHSGLSDIFISKLLLFMVIFYVIYYVHEAEMGYLKKLWSGIPYILGHEFFLKAISGDIICKNFREFLRIVFLISLYFVGKNFQSYF